MNIFLLVVIGLFAGMISGLIGIGGGVIITPALVLLMGFSQHQAQGTTIALLVPPIGILAAWEYYQKGFVDIRFALLICVGFLIGGYLGSKIALSINEYLMRRIFSLIIILTGVLLFFKE